MIDAHVHLYDSTAIGYGIFERRDPTFEALVGDYSALPRSYTVADYRRATAARPVAGMVWRWSVSPTSPTRDSSSGWSCSAHCRM